MAQVAEINSPSREVQFPSHDLYLILNLDEDEVRSRDLKEQDRVITKAYRKRIRRCHPDRCQGGSDEIAKQLNSAYDVLKNCETRASYHDASDFSRSLLRRLKAILSPESSDKDSRSDKEKLKRRLCFVACCVLLVGGLALGIGTAGLGLPILIGCGAAAGACFNAGIFGLKRICSKETFQNGLDGKKLLKSMAIGGMFGAIAGSLTSGILTVLSEVALGSAVLEYFIAGTPCDAINGVLFAIANDVIETKVDKKQITTKEIILNAIKGGFKNMNFSGNLRRFINQFEIIVNSIPDDCKEHIVSVIKTGCAFKNAVHLNYEDDDQGNDDVDGDSENKSHRHQCGKISYACKQPYFTRMIVKYKLEKVKYAIIKKGSGSEVVIPGLAKNIRVQFQVMRFIAIWCDVKKWNRHTLAWIRPVKPHVFKLKKPVTRKFTIDGSLYFEAVTKITNEDCEIIRQM